MTERLLLPFGVYNTERCAMCWIGLYENEDDVWQTFLGWPSREEIDFAKSQGLVVLPLSISYKPPNTIHPPVRILKCEDDGVVDGGGFEVRFNDGRPSKFFYWRDEAREKVLEEAKKFAREERDKIQVDK